MLQLDPRPSGGAALEQLAKSGNPRAIPFAIPMWQRLTCDFSYAGLKTSARLAIQANLPDPADPSPAARQVRESCDGGGSPLSKFHRACSSETGPMKSSALLQKGPWSNKSTVVSFGSERQLQGESSALSSKGASPVVVVAAAQFKRVPLQPGFSHSATTTFHSTWCSISAPYCQRKTGNHEL